MKMQKTRMMRIAGVSAVVLSAGLWALFPAWGQSSPAKGKASIGGTGNVALTKDIAAAERHVRLLPGGLSLRGPQVRPGAEPGGLPDDRSGYRGRVLLLAPEAVH